jgi:hypothetical protein
MKIDGVPWLRRILSTKEQNVKVCLGLPLPFETLFPVPSQPMTQKGKRRKKEGEKIEKEKEKEEEN